MGKLRDLLSNLIRYSPQKKMPGGICTHPNLPQKQHYTKLVVNANDHCHTCEKHICLVCSQVHVQQHCELDLKVNKVLGEGPLKDFNLGYLMEVSLSGLKCICGAPLAHDPSHAICAACGVATCSEECHSEWERRGNCTYASNYYQKPKEINMRSILFQNIRNVQRAKIREWNLASKSSLSYIACYAKAGASHVYLQRGYRNYGFPQNELIQRMKRVQFGLDLTTHIERVCQCQCRTCKQRGFHSVGNCEYSCVQMTFYNQLEIRGDPQMFKECTCDCAFCRSGVVVARHSLLECGFYCPRSNYNLNDE